MTNSEKVTFDRLFVPIFFVAVLLPMAAMGAPGSGQCGTGKLLDVQRTTETIQGGTWEHGRERVTKNGKREYNGYSSNYQYTQITYTVTVRLQDMVYTAQSVVNLDFGFKPTSYTVNDPIQTCLRGSTLALARPDGKEYKAHIVRVARDPIPESNVPAGSRFF